MSYTYIHLDPFFTEILEFEVRTLQFHQGTYLYGYIQIL